MNGHTSAMLGIIWVLTAIVLLPLQAQAEECDEQRFESARYFVCTVDPSAADLRVFWKNADGEPYRYFSSVAEAVAAEGKTLTLALNAGMYLPDFSPTGLYVEDGTELRPANTAVMEGTPSQIPNFYKQPNGVFYLTDRGAGILPTKAFLEQKPQATIATQSGPMLVIGNALHPALIPNSIDKTRRSGVGVCADGVVRFAISDDRVNFHEFARLFRDQLQCPNALFLDGGRGAGIYNPTTSRNDRSWHGGFGPMLGLVE